MRTSDTPGAVVPGQAVTVAGANVRAVPDAVGSLLALSPDVLVVSGLSPDLDPVPAVAYP